MSVYKASILAFAVLFSVASASAQTSMGIVRGSVNDEQGGGLPGVTVTARQVETNTTRSTVTSPVGQFFLANLPAGTYELVAELAGFSPGKRPNLPLSVGQELTADFVLKLAGVQESVLVTAQAAMVETQHTLGEIIGNKQIDDLPTVSRDFADLAKLAPGTSTSTFSGANTGSGLSFGGQRQYENNILVDGATNLMQFYGRQSNSMPQDWIQEFQVMTNAFSAEFGQASGGILNVITRSGTNGIQGRGYGFFRDAALDSPPFAGRFVDGQPQFLTSTPPFTQKRFGGFLGGPIVKDKLFFFGGVEDLNLTSSIVLGISDYWRQQGVKSLLEGGTQDTTYLLKGDWNLKNSNRISVRYNDDAHKDLNLSLRGTALDTEEPRYTFGGPLWNVVGNWTSTLSNSRFNEFRVFYGVNKPFITCNLAGAGGKALLAKAPLGTYAIKTYPGAVFGCTGFDGLEGEANLFFIENLSFVAGHHQMKVGGQLSRSTLFMDVEDTEKGSWGFPQDRVFSINDPASYPDTFSGNLGLPVFTGSYWSPSVFFQDTWQVRDGLTLNLGVRYDVDGTILSGNELVDKRNAELVAELGGPAPLEKLKLDLNNVAPRMGFVWLPTADHRTTIRGSGGMFYSQNHFNYNDIYISGTLAAAHVVSFNANNSTANPFWNPADTAGSIAALRAFLAQSYPLFPDITHAAIAKQSISGLDSTWKIPYSVQATGGFTHSFENGLTFQADYVYIRGVDLPITINTNLTKVNGQFVTIDQRFNSISYRKNVGWNHYNGLQTNTEYRRGNFRAGLAYTLSRTTSDTATGITSGPNFSGATNPLDLSIDIGPDNADRRHNLVASESFLFPLDIQVAAIGVYRSPLPYSVSSRFVVFARPEPRNSRRGDTERSVDFRLSKIIKLGARVRVHGFWELFNAFNWTNFANYQGSLESPSFALPIAAADKRRQQFGFRVDF